MNKLYILIGLIFTIVLPAYALVPTAISISGDAYAYATTSVQKNGAVFFTLKNHQLEDDTLIKASAAVSERVELHTHIMDGDMMMMREVEGYDLPAEGEVTLEPMGHHIMLIGLKEPLKDGESFPLKLEFEKHFPIEITVQIKNPGAE